MVTNGVAHSPPALWPIHHIIIILKDWRTVLARGRRSSWGGKIVLAVALICERDSHHEKWISGVVKSP
jgi:hypothetical protein